MNVYYFFISESQEDVGEKPVLETLTFAAEANKPKTPEGEQLPCLQCDYVSDSKEDILAHLLLSHKFIVADVNFVAFLPE